MRLRLTVAEYCAATGAKPSTVRRALREGRLRGVDLNAGTGKGPRWRVRASQVMRETK